MKRLAISFIALGGLAATSFSTPAISAEQYTFAVGSLGGTFGRLGAGLAENFNNHAKGIKLSVIPGGGRANPKMIGSGKADIGFSFANLSKNALKGQSPYGKKFSNLRMIGTFYYSCYHMYSAAELVDGGIKTFDDFVKSKKPLNISVGKRGSSTEYITGLMVKHNGSSYDDLKKRGFKLVFAGVGASARQLSSRSLDFYNHNSGIPNAKGIEAHLSRPLKFMTLSESTRKMLLNAGFNDCVIPGGIYKGAPKDTPSVGTSGVVIGTDKTPDKLVYNLLKISWDHVKTLHNVHKIFKRWSLKKAATKHGFPFHPAAEKFYKEKGVL